MDEAQIVNKLKFNPGNNAAAMHMNKLLKSIAFGALPILLFSSTLNASHKSQGFTTAELEAFCTGSPGCIARVQKGNHLMLDLRDSTELIDDNAISRFNATSNMSYTLGISEIPDKLISRISQLNNITGIDFIATGGGFQKILQVLPQPAKIQYMPHSSSKCNTV